MHGASFVVDLGAVLAVAALTSVITRWLKQPTILGYLFAGLIVGPYIPIPVFADHERVEALAELGVVLVMFAVGLEFRIAKLLRVLPTAGVTGIVQVGFLVWCGFSFGQLLGWTVVASVFLGASIAISSTMVVSKVYGQASIAAPVREHVFGVLVVQDVLAIVLIAVTTGVAAGGGLAPKDLLLTLARLAGLLVVLIAGGLFIVPPIVRRAVAFESKEILVVVALGLCFALAIIADRSGYSVALGAFIAGILVAESGHGDRVEHLIEPLRDMFAALFFVSIGMTVDPIVAARFFGTSLGVFAIVIIGQLVVITFVSVASGNGLRRSIIAGLSLGQIGEFAFIIAAVGREAKVVPEMLHPVLVTVAVLTAFTTPLIVNRAERIADRIEARLPRHVFVVLRLYETWRLTLERHRSIAGRRQFVRLLRSIALDATAVVVFLTVVVAWRPELSSLATSVVGEAGGPWLVGAGVIGGAGPLIFALVRASLQLSRHLGHELLPADARTSEAARLVVRTLHALVHLLVLLTVGVPAVAVLRPFVGIPIGGPLLGAAVLAFIIYLWRNTSAVEVELRSGTERLASALAEQTSVVDPTGVASLPIEATLPGLDRLTSILINAGHVAVGQTLADLDVRRRTGATVISIAHMPEIVDLYDEAVELAGGSDLVARFLSGYRPPAYIAGCSQAVFRDEFLIRNYDYARELWDALIIRTGWGGRRVVGMSDSGWGLLDGINDSGLAVSLSFGGRKVVGDGFGIPVVIRYVLQTCTDVAGAVDALQRVPVHMAYNVTLMDATGAFATVLIAPDREPSVTERRVITNHQYRVEWHRHAIATGSVDRLRVLMAHVRSPDETAPRFVRRFLEPPVHSKRHDAGIGTLYTAVYRPSERRVSYLWPSSRWDADLESPLGGSREVDLS